MSSHPTAETVVAAFKKQYGYAPTMLVRAPGRVSLLGAHVDYNEGWVLPAAIDRSVWLAVAPIPDRKVRIYSQEFDQQGAFDLADRQAQTPAYPWLKYPLGIAWAMQMTGYSLAGMDALIASDIPIGAGVSSSAALEMAFVLAWSALGKFRIGGLARARIGQKAENEYLNIGSGIMDQFACVYGAADHMILLDCRTLEHQLISVPSQTAVIIADSGVRRELTAIDYNVRPEECREATDILRQFLPDIQTLRDVSTGAFEFYAYRLPPTLRRRARHVIEECARVLEGAQALRQGDVAKFGELICQSQISSRDNYENSIPELDLLASTAWQTTGCYGARFAGAGFGGVMQVFCDETAVPDIQQAMSEAFEAEFKRPPPMFTCKIADGAELTFL